MFTSIKVVEVVAVVWYQVISGRPTTVARCYILPLFDTQILISQTAERGPAKSMRGFDRSQTR